MNRSPLRRRWPWLTRSVAGPFTRLAFAGCVALSLAAALPALAQPRPPSPPASGPLHGGVQGGMQGGMQGGDRADRAELERTAIVGHQELPKVLHIVPWKKPLPGALAGRPPASLVDELLAPLDRAEFRRELAYRAQLAGRAGAAPSTPTPPAANPLTVPPPARQEQAP